MQGYINRRCKRVLATKYAPRYPFRLLERRHGLAEINERGVVGFIERAGVNNAQGVRHASNYLGLVARYVALVIANAWRTRGPLRIISLLCVVGAAWTASAAARTEHGDDCPLAQ